VSSCAAWAPLVIIALLPVLIIVSAILYFVIKATVCNSGILEEGEHQLREMGSGQMFTWASGLLRAASHACRAGFGAPAACPGGTDAGSDMREL
jgi:hypothetical protein